MGWGLSCSIPVVLSKILLCASAPLREKQEPYQVAPADLANSVAEHGVGTVRKERRWASATMSCQFHGHHRAAILINGTGLRR